MWVYRFHTWDIPTGDMSHLRRQLLTGDARRVPMACLYEYCLPRRTSLVRRSGNPQWWRRDTYSVELTRLTDQLTNSNYFKAAAVPFYTRPRLLAASPNACS